MIPFMSMKIITKYWAKPIPMRSFDWAAYFDNYEPGLPIGHGPDEESAINDLLEQLDDCS